MPDNPMAGPSYITALKNAAEKNRAAYTTPPRTGGRQMSIRLDDFLLNHVEAVAELAQWDRSAVVYALAHWGLFCLYQTAPAVADEAVALILKKFKDEHGI